jgi:hypothetical protein
MSFVHKINGQLSNVPWDAQEAKTLGYARYMDDRGCEKCGQQHVGRYVETGECVNCALTDAAEVWQLWKMGSPDRPEKFPLSKEQAIDLGIDYFYREQLCKGGAHFVQPHIKTGRCVACEKLKQRKEKGESASSALMQAMPDMVLKKEDAAALGLDVYRTGEICRRGHTGWRYISNGACISCMRGKATTQFEPIDMDKLITVTEQMQLFIGYAWDGRRIVDPDGAKYTIAQFNIMVGGAGRYEVKGGKPDVFTSHEAFMRNFGPLRD